MTVPPALLSHESTEHYTPQYILDAVIACMGVIDLDPCSNSKEIPIMWVCGFHDKTVPSIFSTYLGSS